MPMPGPANVRQQGVVLLAAAVGAFWLPATQARAQEYPEGEPPSAVAQYVEAVDTASAPSAPSATDETRSKLPPPAKRALKQASPSVARALERVATSSVYGAPSNRKATLGSEPDLEPSSNAVSAALRSTASAVGATTDTRLLGLLMVVLVTTVGASAIAVRRARSSSAIARSEQRSGSQ